MRRFSSCWRAPVLESIHRPKLFQRFGVRLNVSGKLNRQNPVIHLCKPLQRFTVAGGSYDSCTHCKRDLYSSSSEGTCRWRYDDSLARFEANIGESTEWHELPERIRNVLNLVAESTVR